MNHTRIASLLFLSFILLPGCLFFHNGERITGQIKGGKLIPDSASRIFIKPVTGALPEPEFEDLLLLRLKNMINLDGRLAVVDSENEADIVLRLEITTFGEQNIAFDESGRAVTVRISITLKVTLSERGSGREIVSGKTTDSQIVYDADMSVRDEVLRSLADRCSERVLSIIHTGWDSGKK